MEENKTTKTIEETMEELDAIIEKMEDRESTLEESFACFETGMKLVRECSSRIDKVEKQIMVLSEEGMEEYES
ncbi:MAG: exodeoxyribonuclease VII small subunit [Hungatella sp.]|nr:exodeoxyribonuclease VII small subunit [Hungatella sp.]